jgi:hypothetical protein
VTKRVLIFKRWALNNISVIVINPMEMHVPECSLQLKCFLKEPTLVQEKVEVLYLIFAHE